MVCQQRWHIWLIWLITARFILCFCCNWPLQHRRSVWPHFLAGKAKGRSKITRLNLVLICRHCTSALFRKSFISSLCSFAIFDVEALFLFAWSVSVRESGWVGFIGSNLYRPVTGWPDLFVAHRCTRLGTEKINHYHPATPTNPSNCVRFVMKYTDQNRSECTDRTLSSWKKQTVDDPLRMLAVAFCSAN